jgi:hypothetical protein
MGGYGKGVSGLAVPRITNVTVVDSPDVDPKNPQCPRKRILVVDQEPIYFFNGQGSGPVRWQMGTNGFMFAQSSPDPTPVGSSPQGQVHTCQRQSDGTFQCTNRNNSAGAWKYKLSATASDGCQPPDDLDPTIVNG